MTEQVTIDAVARLLEDAPVLGAELDTGYRVLAVTVEPRAEVHPSAGASDRRLQLLIHPVSRVAAVLVETTSTPPVLRRFTEEQLTDVVAALDAPTGEWRFGGEPPRPEAWAPELSMEGASNALDGRSHHAVLDLSADDGQRLRLAVWFDDIDVRDAGGNALMSTTTGPLGLG